MTLSRQKLRALKKMVEEHPDEVLDLLLQAPFWPRGLEAGKGYVREGDDTDGHHGSTLTVFIGPAGTSRSGDVWVEVHSKIEDGSYSNDHCFRSEFGGGNNLLVNRAFLFVARAMQVHDQMEKERSHHSRGW